MITSRLDKNNDWTFGSGLANYLKNEDAIVQNVITRLRSFKNDWFLDSEANIDWIGILGARNNKTAILSEVERVVLNTKGVTKITSLTSTLKSQRGIQINVKFVTVYNNEFEIIEEV